MKMERVPSRKTETLISLELQVVKGFISGKYYFRKNEKVRKGNKPYFFLEAKT